MATGHYLVLARKWRPQTFEEVVGQEHITRTLQNAISAGRVGHAFLFIGSRGIGKTTTARILAKALNCQAADAPTPAPCGVCDNCRTIADGTNIDVIEIDGASNNRVDDVREIREHIRLVPSHARYKIYIIDEVHQLSQGAFNALLKTLEEPPAHAVFVLATTEAHKIPATIISRCQRYDFRRVSMNRLTELLRKIVDTEGVTCSDEALYAIARAAEGGIRDAESILDQLMSYCGQEITFRDVTDVLGLVDWRLLHDLCAAILARDVGKQLETVENVVAAGKDLSQFVQELLQYFRNLLVCKTADAKTLLSLPEEELKEMQARADAIPLIKLIRLVEQFAELTKGFDSEIAQRIALEALLIRISKAGVALSVDTVLEKLLQLGAPAGLGGSAPAQGPQHLGAASATVALAPPRDESPAPAPAGPAKQHAVPGQLDAAWDAVRTAVEAESLQASLWLGFAAPVAIDGAALVVQTPAENAQAREALDKEPARPLIEQALAAVTDNLTTFRCVLADRETAGPAETPQAAPHAGHATEADARGALQDPHVAKVVDVFKGRIVDVKHAPRPDAHTED